MENKVILKVVIAIIVIVAIAAAAKMYINRHDTGQSDLPAQATGTLTTKPVNGEPESAPKPESATQPN